MGPAEILLHLSAFVAPAVAVGIMVALVSRVLVTRRATLSWWSHSAINSVAGTAVLIAGLWHFGVDGKMVTYAVLVVAVATAQWLAGRAWKG